MKTLAIAKDLKLPLDVVTQTIAILAKRRAGKSYTMRRVTEQLLKAGQQVVLVDPKGDQWGLRFAADGKAPGLAVIILGGERGDVPLEVGAGEVVAKLVVEERVSVILDLSLFRKHEVATFMTAFMENLYRLKARETYRTPMMLVIDEADAIAPQKPQKGEERMLGAAEDIVRRGGQRGIGCLLVTQRSAVLNKNVLTQAQMLVVLRTIAPQDLKAMKAWIDVHGDDEQGATLMESLPALPVGDAWFWSPGWPTTEGIFQRTRALPIETFDSGKSPDPGTKPVEPKKAADVDLAALQRQMAATIEKAKADDPRELKKQLAEARAALAKVSKTGSVPADRTKAGANYSEFIPKVVEKKVIGPKEAARLEGAVTNLERLRTVFADLIERADGIGQKARDVLADIQKTAVDVRQLLAPAPAAVAPVPSRQIAPARAAEAAPTRPVSAPRPQSDGAQSSDLPPAKRRILNALAFLEGIGIHTAERNQLAFLSETTSTSGAYLNNLSALRTGGYIDYPSQGMVTLTESGRAIADGGAAPSSTQELHRLVRAKLPPAKWRIVEALIEHYPTPVSRDNLAAMAGTTPTSGAYLNNVSALRTLGLLDYPRQGEVVAQPVLFLEHR